MNNPITETINPKEAILFMWMVWNRGINSYQYHKLIHL